MVAKGKVSKVTNRKAPAAAVKRPAAPPSVRAEAPADGKQTRGRATRIMLTVEPEGTCSNSSSGGDSDEDIEIVAVTHASAAAGAAAAAEGAAVVARAGKSRGSASAGSSGAADRAARKAQVAAMEAKEYFTSDQVGKFRTALLSWYDEHHRVLPWRRNAHSRRPTAASDGAVTAAAADLPLQDFAYREWVSEIMLQQTQVATVIPYFNKWIARWPHVQDLAQATVEEVNTMWAGLGYYRRARYLLDGAKYVVDKLGGEFPTTAKQLLDVPGVGAYTSAAVASIAFGEPVAAVDGNVVRVASRLCALSGDPAALAPAHAAIAQQLLDHERPGDFNQAMMELGATVCRASSAECPACPVRDACAAHLSWSTYLAGGGEPDMEDAPHVTRYPTKVAKAGKRAMSVAVCVLEVLSPSGKATPRTVIAALGDQHPPAAAATATAAAATASAGTAAAAASRPKPSKRQRTLLDFAVGARAASELNAPSSAEAAGTSSGQAGRTAVPQPLAEVLSRSERRYLLVQRPAEGLLAGLWEFPGIVFEGDLTSAARKALVDAKLAELLGPGVLTAAGVPPAVPPAVIPLAARVLARRDVGTYIHVFSHIRQTNHVERLTVQVDDFEALRQRVDEFAAGALAGQAADASRPLIKWVAYSDLPDAGLTTSVRKIHALACGQ